jgi:Holliday junction resolvase-like predicted endonuclease
MNRNAKGARSECEYRDILEKQGYQVTRSGGSLGEWDLIAIGSCVILVQVKSGSEKYCKSAYRKWNAPKSLPLGVFWQFAMKVDYKGWYVADCDHAEGRKI